MYHKRTVSPNTSNQSGNEVGDTIAKKVNSSQCLKPTPQSCLLEHQPIYVVAKIHRLKLSLIDQTPDIFGRCGTYITDNVDERLWEHTGYVTERRDQVGQAGGHLLCNVRDDLACQQRSELEHEDIEINWLKSCVFLL